jgi:hypothetical protein
MDTYVKALLTVIAACLLLQVAQGFGLAAPGRGQPAPSAPPPASDYVIQAIPMARLVLRFDPATGRTWTMPLQFRPGGAPKNWTLVGEASPETAASEEVNPPPPPEAGEGDR